MKKVLSVILILVLVLSASGCSKVPQAEKAIAAIGTVTLDSKAAIEEAEEIFYSLSEQDQATVTNAITLRAAREEYNRLYNILRTALDAIAAIGEVNLDSTKVISYARECYDALAADNLTTYASAHYPTLQAAEKAHAQMLYDEAARLYRRDLKADALDYLDMIIIYYPDLDITEQAKEDGRDLTLEFAELDFQAGNWEAVWDAVNYCDYFYTPNHASDAMKDRIYTKLAAIRPKNGTVLWNTLGSSYGTFNFYACDEDVCIKLEREDTPGMYAMIYIRAGESGTIYLANGTYTIEYCVGDHWFGRDALFGADTTYYRVDATATFTTRTEGWTIYYTDLTLDFYDLENGTYDFYEIEKDGF